ncbi:P-loop NTPase [Microbacterium sp. BK668]|uniref:AAA family ATPase n=1 Tax=Microbacterium sp. BK668 TaxID=2512118 RepID=UPI00105D8FC7|nr:P-loop NTPase [Microbacterium sp. BK668]TDN88437.1 MinD-like ATPase involved in chromosome partitioning or flagellar assembly [Microbacterium sp. BK668]
MTVLVAVDEPRGSALAADLEREGVAVVDVIPASALAAVAADGLHGLDADRVADAVHAADTVVLQADRSTLTASAVALCDRCGVRILPLAKDAADSRLVETFGLAGPWPLEIEPWRLVDAIAGAAAPAEALEERRDGSRPGPRHPRLIAVWGPAGGPGRTTIAIELAVELARGGRHVGLVDADTHAPSMALQLGLADEGPGFAAACRQAELGGLDSRELTRISSPLGRTGVDVLTGINRPSRWPELSDGRVAAALAVCREWADYTVVDVAAPLERDEEIVSDLDGPRRNAATLAALRSADLVVAVAAADPVGIARFLRAHAELRATIGSTPVAVLANRLRPGTLGLDARGQVRRTLDRFAGIRDLWFVPTDARSTDAAILAARPVAEIAPKSPLTLAVRRFAGEAVAPPPDVAEAPRRGIRSSASRAA